MHIVQTGMWARIYSWGETRFLLTRQGIHTLKVLRDEQKQYQIWLRLQGHTWERSEACNCRDEPVWRRSGIRSPGSTCLRSSYAAPSPSRRPPPRVSSLCSRGIVMGTPDACGDETHVSIGNFSRFRASSTTRLHQNSIPRPKTNSQKLLRKSGKCTSDSLVFS